MTFEASLLTLEAVRKYRAEHGYSPSIRQLCDLRGLSSTSTVHAHLKMLKRHGLIVWDRSMPRSYMPSDELPSVTRVANQLRSMVLTQVDADRLILLIRQRTRKDAA